MNVDGKPFRTIWTEKDSLQVFVIDQTRLPHEFVVVTLKTLDDTVGAINDMLVRGAPLIGAAGAYGIYLAMQEDPTNFGLEHAYSVLLATRPTGANLRRILDNMCELLWTVSPADRVAVSNAYATNICEKDVVSNELIGKYGFQLIDKLRTQKKLRQSVNILTHCNAGWLATVDKGTALAPVYLAHDSGIPVHVWVDETRPRNQGASLTAWELGKHGVPYTVIADNVGGHLMQHGMVDICIVGSDRTTATGDVCNKIGTYLKALAAKENGVPFYVALPSLTIDWTIEDGIQDVPIEQRDPAEVSCVTGKNNKGEVVTVSILPKDSPVVNYSFDVTPARYVTGFITENGLCSATREGLLSLFPQEA